MPGVVLDPFVGSGTTLEVALKLGRRAVGADQADVSVLAPEKNGVATRCDPSLEMTSLSLESNRSIPARQP